MKWKNEKIALKFYTNLQVNFTVLPSGTTTSDDVSSVIKSGGITTSK